MTVLAIGEFCETGSGGTPSRSKLKEYYEGGTIPWIKSGELDQSVVDAAEEFITEKGLSESSAKLLRPGAILIAMYGATVGQVSRLAIPAATNQAVCHIYPDVKLCEPDYLYRVLKGAKDKLLAKRVGGGQPNISQKILRDLQIPLPPLAEQKRIAAILDAADALRAKRRESLAQLDTLLQATFLDMFGDPVTNPKGWKMVGVGDEIEFLTSGSRGWAKYYADSGDTFIRIQNLKNGRLDLNDIAYVNAPESAEAKRTRVAPGDVLLSITADLGRTAVVPVNIGKAHINQHLAILRFKELNPVFVSYQLASNGGQSQFDRLNREGVKAGLNFNDVKSIQLTKPPLDLQQRFATIVESVEQQKARLRDHLAELDTLFASLQQRAFTGNL